jgi:hypothetical protein
MLKAMLQKSARTVGTVLLLVIAVCLLVKMGMQPLWAVIGILLLRGIVRFVFRLTVMLVSITITIAIFIALIAILL